MSKESVERGLGMRFHGTPQREKAKRDEPLKRGTFVPEASDLARLRVNLRGAPRRS
jgi:hypothetical protein